MFKPFDIARDIVNQISVVNEVLTFGRAIFTGSTTEENIKKFNHWLSGSSSGSFYHALYSTNYSSSVSTELLNVTFGHSVSSSFHTATGRTNTSEKNRIYRLFAKQLLGNESSFFNIGNTDRHELVFISLKRSQYKDEIKKGTVALQTIASGSRNSINSYWEFADTNAANDFTKTVGGDVGKLMTGSRVAGLIYYNAGVIALVPDIMSMTGNASTNPGNFWSGSTGGAYYDSLATSGGLSATRTFDAMLDGVRYRINSLSIVNQSNLHSTFYFCRAFNDEFNYSSNPTFIDSSGRIIVTSGSSDLSTRTYVTKIGLVGENNETLAVASLSKPIKKTPDSEFTVKVRLDY